MRNDDDPVAELIALSRTFGGRAAAAKKACLRAIARRDRLARGALCALHETLCFLRAHPDDAELLDLVIGMADHLRRWREVLPPSSKAALDDRGFPGGANTHVWSHGMLEKLSGSLPGQLEIAWEGIEDEMLLHQALVVTMLKGEAMGLDDTDVTWREWMDACKPDPGLTDLQFLLSIFRGASLQPEQRAFIFDACALPVRYSLARPGTSRLEVVDESAPIHFQKQPIDRERRPLRSLILRPLRRMRLVSPREGERLVELALQTLAARNLEILLLTHANARDVWLVEAPRGLRILLVGVVPEERDPLNVSYTSLVLKNGVPIGYGPASVCLGCCEMGLNLFPEYRGAGVPSIYAQLMRALHHVLGASYFFLTSYGMGEGNPEALRTGAFWFYRKLGFRATNPEVEALATTEEARMRADPAYRCGLATLRRLSHTEAHFDLSGGRLRPLDQGTIGLRLTRHIEERHGGDRARVLRRSLRRARRALQESPSRPLKLKAEEELALAHLAPILDLLPDPAGWPRQDRRLLRRFLAAKGGRSEAASDGLLLANVSLTEGLRALARS